MQCILQRFWGDRASASQPSPLRHYNRHHNNRTPVTVLVSSLALVLGVGWAMPSFADSVADRFTNGVVNGVVNGVAEDNHPARNSRTRGDRPLVSAPIVVPTNFYAQVPDIIDVAPGTDWQWQAISSRVSGFEVLMPAEPLLKENTPVDLSIGTWNSLAFSAEPTGSILTVVHVHPPDDLEIDVSPEEAIDAMENFLVEMLFLNEISAESGMELQSQPIMLDNNYPGREIRLPPFDTFAGEIASMDIQIYAIEDSIYVLVAGLSVETGDQDRLEVIRSTFFDSFGLL